MFWCLWCTRWEKEGQGASELAHNIQGDRVAACVGKDQSTERMVGACRGYKSWVLRTWEALEDEKRADSWRSAAEG